MGLIQNGKWVDKWYDTDDNGGEFRRQESRFRDSIRADPDGRFPAQSGRYHLYVSLACPWAHRTLIFRALKGLTEHIGVSLVKPLMLDNGWELQDDQYGLAYLYELYLKADPAYEGRVTVPVLWDKQTKTIVSNESAEIIRMFNSAFDDLTGNRQDFYPETLRRQIDELNERIYHTVNNGVYRAGFATTQAAYEEAFYELFDTLDWLEIRLKSQPYLAGTELTEADWRLFTTLIRFDAVYYGHFKCNKKRLVDYPVLSAYVRGLYGVQGVADTVNFEHIKQHYYGSHKSINPSGIVPLGPEQDF
jgi:putative glutathione S-transferase